MANNTLRTLPPSQSQWHAHAHDEGIWETFCGILGADEHRTDKIAELLATLPASMGGLGLRSAVRTSVSAYWAAWVDALPVLTSKAPSWAAQAVVDLERHGGPSVACMAEAAEARASFVECGAEGIPT